MQLVAIDVGNSKTSIALFDDAQLQSVKQIPTDPSAEKPALLQSYQDLFEQNILDLPIYAASVVAPISEILQNHATMVTPSAPLDFVIKRIEAHTLGSDIIAGSQAVVNYYKPPAIVVDAGTATTVTYINGDSEFLGGVISPGMGISARALFAQTDALKPVALEIPPEVVATNTQHAIQAGLTYGHAGMIEALVNRIKHEQNPTQATVICTGGAIPVLLPILPDHYLYDPHLVLKGIASIGSKHSAH